ncbi:MAG TPA: AraC family transcriptional regulator [Prolixibacteraceae bacterium]
MKFLKVPDKGDPSNIPQIFSGLNINLLCCRFWWLKNWESRNMSFPYWRIYWNKSCGGIISFAGKTIELTPNQIILIPPYTAFSSRLKENTIPPSGYNLEGGRVGDGDPETDLLHDGAVLHLFIHFNLGMPYDFIAPQLFSFDVSHDLHIDLEELSLSLQKNNVQLSVQSSLLIYKIIILTVSQIPREFWNLATTDQRILNVLREVEDHISEELTNKRLAQVANMAVNSFARVFKEEIGVPPQQFVRERRVQKTSILLHHTSEPIEEIARLSGFCDRFHLARVFKVVTSYSPAQYRKQFYPKS